MKQRNGFSLFVTVAAFALMGAVSGCGNSQMTSGDRLEVMSDGNRTSDIETRAVISVTDTNGKAIAGAKILIGMGLNNPFNGNFLTTDQSGKAPVPSKWTGPMPVTIEAPGYVRTTFFDRLPSELEFKLRKTPRNVRYEVRGTTTNYSGLSDGKHINVGLVFPAFSRREVPNIDLAALVSPETDEIKVLGKAIALPSNISVPAQRVNYIISVNLNKPQFRMIFDGPEERKLAVVHVRGVLRDLVDEMDKGFALTQIANKVQFVGGAVKTHAGGDKPAFLSMAVNEETFSPLIRVTAPKFANNQNMIAVAVPAWGGAYAISDVKGVKSGASVTLAAPRNGLAQGLVVSLLRMNRKEESLSGVENSFFSAAITRANQSQAINFLEMIKAPEVRANTLVLQPPRSVAGVEKVMTRAVLSRIEIPADSKYKLERKTPQWELYAKDWTSSLTLPEWPNGTAMKPGKMRWEAEFAGVPTAEMPGLSGSIGVNMLEKVTHVTRSGLDF